MRQELLNKVEAAAYRVSSKTDIPLRKIVSRSRDRETSFARSAFCNYLKTRYNFSSTQIGVVINRNHSTVLRIILSLRGREDDRSRYTKLFGKIDSIK